MAHEHLGGERRTPWRWAVPLVCCGAGVMFVGSAISSGGTDLRSDTADLSTLVEERADRVARDRTYANDLRHEVDSLSQSSKSDEVTSLIARGDRYAANAGFTAVTGPGLRVTLSDAPRSSDSDDVDPNLLVVHQQDLQAFINALWEGGATAITLQGQRIISTTGIKCVGNTVILHGVPYAPPYEIEAIGDPDALKEALVDSPEVAIYREYVDTYELGLTEESETLLSAPAYSGEIDLRYAAIRR